MRVLASVQLLQIAAYQPNEIQVGWRAISPTLIPYPLLLRPRFIKDITGDIIIIITVEGIKP